MTELFPLNTSSCYRSVYLPIVFPKGHKHNRKKFVIYFSIFLFLAHETKFELFFLDCFLIGFPLLNLIFLTFFYLHARPGARFDLQDLNLQPPFLIVVLQSTIQGDKGWFYIYIYDIFMIYFHCLDRFSSQWLIACLFQLYCWKMMQIRNVLN